MDQGLNPRSSTDPRQMGRAAEAAGWTPLLEKLPLGLLLVDEAGQVVAANAAASRILRTDRGTLVAQAPGSLLGRLQTPSGEPLTAQGLAALGDLDPRKTSRLGWVLAPGGILWLDWSAEPLPQGGLLLTVHEAGIEHDQDLFAKVFRACPDAITISSMEDGTYLEVNEVMLDVMGLPREAVVGRSSLDLKVWVDPEDRRRYLAELSRNGFLRNHETRFRVASGRIKPFLVSSEVIHSEGRSYALNFMTDLTERRGVEATLREVLEHAQGASYKRNLVTNAYEYMSPIFTVLTGRTVEEVNSLPLEGILELIHPDDVPAIQARVGAALQDREHGHHRVDYRFRHRDGHYLWFRDEFKILCGDDGLPLAMVGCVSDITASKAVEDELHQSQANLEALIESSSDLIWSVDQDHALISFNAAMARHLAAAYGTVARKGRNAADLLPEKRAALFSSLYVRAFAEGPFRQELDLEDGRVLELALHPIRHGEAVIGASVFGKDITEQRRKEQELKDSVTQTQALLRAIPDLMFVNSRDGEFLDFSAHYPGKLMQSPEAFLHKGVTEVLPPPLGERFLAAFERALALNEIQEIEYDVAMGGEALWFEARVVPCGEDRVVTITRDITQEKRVADSLIAAETKYRVLAENVGDVLWILNLHTGQFEYVSPSVQRLRGMSPEEVMAQPIADALTPDSARKVLEQIPARLAAFRPDDPATAIFTDEVDQPRKDGTIVSTEVTTRYLVGPDGVLDRILGVSRDITERKLAEQANFRLQAEVDHLQKLESLGRLAGGVAHDMNNVLGAILALASAHLAIQDASDPTRPAFQTINDAAQRGGDMVKRLLTFARQNAVESRELDLNALLLEEVRLLERTTLAKVHLELDLAPDLRPIQGDGSALAHAFMNLCVNAVDAMGEGGTLVFRTCNLEGDQVEVVVADTGCGMSREVLARAMDPYFTTKEVGKGTGLGLSMVHTTVKSHRGHVSLESEPGKGTTVRLVFPATVTRDPGQGSLDSLKPAPATASLGILLVDDDELVQQSTRMLVQVLGHRATVAACGEAALDLVRNGLRPDVVILDMNMPGLGGKGTLPRLRELCPRLPVLLATGRADQDALELVEADPFLTLLSKPFSIHEMQAALNQVSG